MSEEPAKSKRPDLFLGLVAPLASPLDRLLGALEQAFSSYGYRQEVVHLIEELRALEAYSTVPESPLDQRYERFMDAGDEVREKTKSWDVMARFGTAKLSSLRKDTTDSDQPRVYIFRSLKHPDEVRFLRRVYGDSFLLIGGFLSRSQRVERLAENIADSLFEKKGATHKIIAERLIERDTDDGKDFGQRVIDTFHMADFFVDLGEELSRVESELERFVDLVFGHPYITPTKEEYGMFHAFAASLRSAALGRQVGAAIFTGAGEILALGANEVPKAGGGSYWPGDAPDGRDFQKGVDSNDVYKHKVFQDVLRRLKERDWLKPEKAELDLPELEQLARSAGIVSGAYFRDLIEFGRCVHAEMSALMDALRRGVSVEGARLFVTTFPCHNCTAHIIAAGIQDLTYIEPYPKSLAKDLFSDSISVEERDARKIPFLPFAGIAPSIYPRVFRSGERKSGGQVLNWKRSEESPRRYASSDSYIQAETIETTILIRILGDAGLQEPIYGEESSSEDNIPKA